MERRLPERVEAIDTSNLEPATFIFLHGYDDDSDGWTNIAHQFQAAHKLPHLTWIFPNAPFNAEARATAWYTPVSFSPIPIPTTSSSHATSEDKRPQTPTPEEVKEETELLESVEYIDTLIDEEVKRGVKKERIVVGGFSQGCAVSLLVGLVGRWRGNLGGVVGLSGYLPSGAGLEKSMGGFDDAEAKEGADEMKDGEQERRMKVFLAHGTRDMLVPMWIFREAKRRVADVVGENNLEGHQYEGLGHASSGAEFRDMCEFLEKVLVGRK